MRCTKEQTNVCIGFPKKKEEKRRNQSLRWISNLLRLVEIIYSNEKLSPNLRNDLAIFSLFGNHCLLTYYLNLKFIICRERWILTLLRLPLDILTLNRTNRPIELVSTSLVEETWLA
ncbi:hypothetical protein EYC84_001344 [Monilinia fructicola]|uniref:Uncharacterized protein n=1 Tax=Monilinia fructicola TaxID=38448 RepID=A0A5M9JPN2_MONFR|nr:hypothetical protein EYC84_001344 [Monilinia fructicola]